MSGPVNSSSRDRYFAIKLSYLSVTISSLFCCKWQTRGRSFCFLLSIHCVSHWTGKEFSISEAKYLLRCSVEFILHSYMTL
jgi:hypothetical protein